MSAITVKRIWSLSLPIIASNLMLPLVGAVDTAMMGHQENSLLIGAVAVGSWIFMFALWTFGFLRMSTGGLVGQSLGSQRWPGHARTLCACFGNCRLSRLFDRVDSPLDYLAWL